MADSAKALKRVINIALAALIVWFLVSHQQKIRDGVANRDSIQYWSTGTLLIHRHNPYSVSDVEDLERSQGYLANRPLMFRCPPWALWMVLPEGLLNSYWAWLCWLTALLAGLLISMRICWKLYGGAGPPPSAFPIAGYLFAPVAACLVTGQIGMLLLLGISLFLWWVYKRPLLAGVALLIPAVKPHIFVMFWLVLALWIVHRKAWSLLGGAAGAFIVANLIALALDPAVYSHYREMLHQQAIQNEFIPSLSGVIRALFFRRFFRVQFVPMGLGLLWSLWFYWKNRIAWNWPEHGPALLIACILTTPYSWMTDEVVVLPAILLGVTLLHRAKRGLGSRFVILVFILLDMLLLLMLAARIPLTHASYFWSSVVWCCWYLYTKSFSRQSEQAQLAPKAQPMC